MEMRKTSVALITKSGRRVQMSIEGPESQRNSLKKDHVKGSTSQEDKSRFYS